MLILGSADLETAKKRAEIGCKLYASEREFDYIVISGGCGAHKSNICEASEMKNYLIEKSVPRDIIFKEEKSKNTAQNYCYSRALRKPDGTKVVNFGDNLYVVSNHWHAISVAACFGEKDSINSCYFIEGSITPSEKDKVDYINIYQNCLADKNYCKSVTWPWVDASFYMPKLENRTRNNRQYLFIKNGVYKKYSSEKKYEEMARKYPFLPEKWREGIDAAFYNKFINKTYLFKGREYLRFTPGNSSIDNGFPKPLSSLVRNLPENWFGGFLDAAFFHSKTKEIYFLKGEEYLHFPFKDKKITTTIQPKSIKNLGSKWPFNWGAGNVDAAYYNPDNSKVYLYREQEYLMIDFKDGKSNNISSNPKKTRLGRPENL